MRLYLILSIKFLRANIKTAGRQGWIGRSWALSHMSTDYDARLERGTGPHPSEQMSASIAQGLHLSIDERDHLFRLAGHTPPARGAASDHVGPGLLRILDRLSDTPAEIITESGETLRQTPLGAALLGDASLRTGAERNLGYR